MTVPPTAMVALAKVAVEMLELTGPTVTVIVGWPLRSVPLALTVKVLAVPAVVPVKVAV